MKNVSLNELKKCFVWIASQASLLKKELNKEITEQYTHKIVQVTTCKKTKKFIIEFSVSCISKGLLFKIPANKLFSDDATLKCFSPSDIKLISILTTKEYYDAIENKDFSYKYKIVQQDFNEFGAALFTIRTSKGDIQKSAVEIMYDEEILMGLSTKDIANIAFTAGCEQSNFRITKKHATNI